MTGNIPGKYAALTLPDTGQDAYFQLAELPGLVGRLGRQRPLLVLDHGAILAAGVEAELDALLSAFKVIRFTGFAPNPKSEHVHAAATAMREHAADIVIGLGGGSCLDVAKVAAVASTADNAMAATRGNMAAVTSGLPIIAIPTTSGTGSEATHFAAIYVDGKKVSVAHPAMRPHAVILDLRFHCAMPPRLAAETGLDALAQSLESLWAVGSTPASLAYADAAARLIVRSLRASVREGGGEARQDMMLGAHLAGQAINLGKTTAAHALSYALTQGYSIPHGHAVALTLGHVAAANFGLAESECLDPRGAEYVRAQVTKAAGYLGVGPSELGAACSTLLRDLQLPCNLQEAGVPREDLPLLAAAADAPRLGNNPRRLAQEHTLQILECAWGSA